jgi:hypothetical protein
LLYLARERRSRMRTHRCHDLKDFGFDFGFDLLLVVRRGWSEAGEQRVGEGLRARL